MIETDYDTFLDSTVGRYTVTGSSFVWCASKELCGAFLWGEPSEDETERILRIFDAYPEHMAARFDIVLDTRGVVGVDPSGLKRLFGWLVAHRGALKKHLRVQANVIREGPIAFLLTGLLPVAAWPVPYQLYTQPIDAFRAAHAEGLASEVEAIADRLRGVSRELEITRAHLARDVDATIGEVSRALATSPRSLQRVLRKHGTSFHAELSTARLRRAQALLASGDDKVATISARVGISERALTLLFRDRTGMSPAAWRKRHSQ
jgi:AraC-like DNA-binding protein